jgi:hypothetical protein
MMTESQKQAIYKYRETEKGRAATRAANRKSELKRYYKKRELQGFIDISSPSELS